MADENYINTRAFEPIDISDGPWPVPVDQSRPIKFGESRWWHYDGQLIHGCMSRFGLTLFFHFTPDTSALGQWAVC